jgi:hypothetical protein
MKKIDCFLIGHNKMNFPEYENSIRQMGTSSGAYRDLSLSYIRYNNTPYHISEIYNLFCGSDKLTNRPYKTGGGYISTPIVQEFNKLSENMVNWGLFADRVGDFVNVRTAISCPFSCAFCGVPEHAGAYQTAGVEVIEKELNQLNKPGSIKSVHFIEDTFNIPGERFKKILKMMKKININSIGILILDVSLQIGKRWS